jgi:hypothetical protein
VARFAAHRGDVADGACEGFASDEPGFGAHREMHILNDGVGLEQYSVCRPGYERAIIAGSD